MKNFKFREFMFYDLDMLERYCHELGFVPTRASFDELEVSISEGVVLVFANLREDEDTLVGFKGASSHHHDKVLLMVGEYSYVELDELDVLGGVKSGDILIGERYLDDLLVDRWLIHKDGRMDLKFVEPGEEIRVWRIGKAQS